MTRVLGEKRVDGTNRLDYVLFKIVETICYVYALFVQYCKMYTFILRHTFCFILTGVYILLFCFFF